MIIIGAGMAGLLAAAMLREEATHVVEAQPALPNNHTSLLRFRSSVVGDTLNIPFKEVRVMKATLGWRNPIADALAYSLKTNGTATLRSIVNADGRVDTRYIAPTDLVSRMSRKVSCPIVFGKRHEWGHRNRDAPIISTIPMPMLMLELGWPFPHPKFQSRKGFNVIIELKGVDAYCTLYVPNPDYPFSRISITGSRCIVECYAPGVDDRKPGEATVEMATHLIGLGIEQVVGWDVKEQTYAKILPIDDDIRRSFITWASRERGVYSLGRFATWRPGLLMDDIVNDVRVIQRLANRTHSEDYHQSKR